ncbi:MAG: hypothetical protein ACRD43_05815, partial [Pyrinomonadaceae bacterium]
MTKIFSLIGLICVLGAAIVRSQDGTSRPLAQLPPTEPFKIKPGSLFSASGASPQINALPVDADRDKIVSELVEALDIVRKNHVNGSTLETGTLVKSSIEGALHTLDPHS